MVKAIIAFMLADACLALISIKVPLFRRNSRKWEMESNVQRFCNCFFLPLVIFILCIIVNWYKDTMLPSTMERKLESKEIEYTLVTDIDEIGDSDLVYEIRKESSEDQIRITILDICKELYENNNNINVIYEANGYTIAENKIIIGYVVVREKKYGLLLKFRWVGGYQPSEF